MLDAAGESPAGVNRSEQYFVYPLDPANHSDSKSHTVKFKQNIKNPVNEYCVDK